MSSPVFWLLWQFLRFHHDKPRAIFLDFQSSRVRISQKLAKVNTETKSVKASLWSGTSTGRLHGQISTPPQQGSLVSPPIPTMALALEIPLATPRSRHCPEELCTRGCGAGEHRKRCLNSGGPYWGMSPQLQPWVSKNLNKRSRGTQKESQATVSLQKGAHTPHSDAGVVVTCALPTSGCEKMA